MARGARASASCAAARRRSRRSGGERRPLARGAGQLRADRLEAETHRRSSLEPVGRRMPRRWPRRSARRRRAAAARSAGVCAPASAGRSPARQTPRPWPSSEAGLAAARLAAERAALGRRARPGARRRCAGRAARRRRARHIARSRATRCSSRGRARAARRSPRPARPSGHRGARARRAEAERRAARRGDPRSRGRPARGGADSWVERLGEIEGALAGARARLSPRWSCEASGLAAAGRAAGRRRPVPIRETLVAPDRPRLAPCCSACFPGAEPVLDPERLSLTHLRRDGAEESVRQPERRRARAAGRAGPAGLRLPAGRARGRGAVPDPRRCPGLCRRGAVRDHEGDSAAGRPRHADPGAHLPARATISASTPATCGSRTVARHRPAAGNSAWTGPAAGVMVRRRRRLERMTA